MPMSLLAQTASLNLLHDPGDERRPETFTVQLRHRPDLCGSLEVAREFGEIDDTRLNGSQMQTVIAWNKEFL